ncbi:ATP-dependent translocase ABCB1-like isoform X2 [Plodia interpunctella]|uniref:ATP-dependent translocase ABCB1-like isoform X2 n=1 Tax=Plodia interpunctella TaxID=58824 RepID=UPI002367D422|nr:ATP-dependent translocase ABCB1-like isoform X2 [Plodia interpunctella]
MKIIKQLQKSVVLLSSFIKMFRPPHGPIEESFKKLNIIKNIQDYIPSVNTFKDLVPDKDESNAQNGGQLIENDDSKITKDEKSQEEEVPNISFFTLYRFATCLDKFFVIIAAICALTAGCSMPFNTILFAYLFESMVTYGMSLLQEKPANDQFLEDLKFFAVWNLVIGIFIVVLTYVATVLMNISAYNQVYKIRKAYLKAALNQDFGYFDTHKTGDFATKMTSDIVKLEEGIGEKLATFLYFQSAFISSIIMSLVKGWKLALLCLISFPVTLFLVGISGWIASRLSKKETVASGKAGSVAEEVIASIRTVYAFSGQKKEIERYQQFLEQARSFFTGIAMGTLFFCIFSAYALSFWFGYKLMIDEPENYDVSTMIAVFFGVMMGSANFGISSTLMEVFGVAKGAGAQIFNLIDNVPTINPLLNKGIVPKSIAGNIELKDVVFRYPSRPDIKVLKGVSLSIKRGQSVALVGHSGCGKSTIIQLLSRYYDALEGTVYVDDMDVRQLSVRWLREQIGLVGQEPVLFNTTVRENIRYGREGATDADIEACARQANAHQFIMKLPKGYDTLVGERGASLSGGQKQRIAIARALVRNPSILLLDEATSALDTSSEAKVQKALDKAQEGRTTVVVAHRLSTIRNVDMIYVFKAGEVIEYGNHVELMEKKGHYYDMVMIQGTTPELEEENGTDLTRQTSFKIESDDEEEAIESLEEDAEDKMEKEKHISFWNVIRLNTPEWKSISVASLCSLLSGFSMPVLAIILGDFVGILSGDNPDFIRGEVRKYALIFVGIGVFAGITNFITVFFYGIAGEYLTERLRRQMFEKILQQEVGFYDDKNNSTGALTARLSGEASAVQGATGQRIGTVLQAAGTFGFSLVLSLYYEWRVGLVALAFVPLLMFIMFREGRMVYSESSGTAKTMENSSKLAVEAVSNVRTVASLGREETFCNDYASQLLPALILAKRSTHLRGLVYGISRGHFNVIYAAVMYYGGTLVVYHNVDYALILKSAQALLMGATSAAQAFAFAPNFQKGIVAAGRVIKLLNKESKIKDPVKPFNGFKGSGYARLKNVNFKYPTRPTIQVLSNLNLEIEKGKTVALVGSSGCGKSTIIQLLERYYDPDRGVVAQDNVPIRRLRLEEARRPIGFVQQEPILFDRTIGENIAYGDNTRQPTTEEIIEAAKQANIHKFIVSLPMGYDTNIGTKGTQLSGGQKQRVAIARALIRRPRMLLLDEATSALDTESEKVVQEALDAAKAGRTCVMIAHRLSTVRDADVIYVLKDGKVVETGKHSELLDLKGIYYNLHRTGNM